eukprot:CFRG1838T1
MARGDKKRNLRTIRQTPRELQLERENAKQKGKEVSDDIKSLTEYEKSDICDMYDLDPRSKTLHVIMEKYCLKKRVVQAVLNQAINKARIDPEREVLLKLNNQMERGEFQRHLREQRMQALNLITKTSVSSNNNTDVNNAERR